MVKFMSGQEQVIGPEKWVVKTPGGGIVTRRQLPLKLAWAVSIHKSQVQRITLQYNIIITIGQGFPFQTELRSKK